MNFYKLFKQFTNVLFLLAIFNVTMPACAEDIRHPEGKHPIMTISEKIQQSMSKASFIAEGHFIEAKPGLPLEPLDEGKGMLEVEFHITRQLDRNKSIDTPVLLRIVAYRPLAPKARQPDKAALVMSRTVERNVSGKMIVYQEYLDELRQARLPLLSTSNYLQEFLITPIAVGGLDTPYRVTDVVVEFNKKYIIFIFPDISGRKRKTLFENGLDIYDAEDIELMNILKNAG